MKKITIKNLIDLLHVKSVKIKNHAVKMSLLMNGSAEITAENCTADSRFVTPQRSIFFALEGHAHDGHAYLNECVKKGARILIVNVQNSFYQKWEEEILEDLYILEVDDTTTAYAVVVNALYEHPTEKLQPVGITGTNGKTTTAWILRNLFEQHIGSCFSLGTLGCLGLETNTSFDLTTPTIEIINRISYEALQQSIKRSIMEVSSIALDQKRVNGIPFKGAVFTNLTLDHLDYHKDMEHYFQAKRKLFLDVWERNAEGSYVVLNIDDDYGRRLYDEMLQFGERLFVKLITFGTTEGAVLKNLRSKEEDADSRLVFQYKGENFEASLPYAGSHNKYNTLAALGALLGELESLNTANETHDKNDFTRKSLVRAMRGLRTFTQVPGRLEKIEKNQISFYVDYAHTPDALERVLLSLKQLKGSHGALWTVFGCGGDRDRTKRPVMGSVAALLSDHVIITSDNPRTEDPMMVLNDIKCGIKREHHSKVQLILDRTEAIKYASLHANPGDTVLIAGKGHENYQIIGTTKSFFSDQEIVKKV
jgi:UDP-N-acetylmuramoyl-L-alanyl-D-glutamate--2,6-diaminopimelate ligase